MKPFSPLYFVKENRTKCILLMFMIFLSYGVYLGGLYVTNPLDNWSLLISYDEKMTTVSPNSDDEDYSEFIDFMNTIAENDNIIAIPHGEYSGFPWETIMGFSTGNSTYTFLSVEDFKTYCRCMNIDCDFDNLKSGSMIMSECFAKNKELNIGDKVDKNYDAGIYDEYTLDALTDEDGYIQYFINEEPLTSPYYILIANGIDGDTFYDTLYDLQQQHNVIIYDNLQDNISSQFDTFNMIYIFIIVLLSIILAVTTNAAFVGLYQRRNYEFAVYRAIGISKWRIIGKIIGELLWMDFIGLIIGGGCSFLGLYLFNNLILYPAGKYLQYFHPLALSGLLLCNIIVILPLVITRVRQMLKADICEY